MRLLRPIFPASILLAALAGCATPQYQTTTRLIPPEDPSGRACVQDCEGRKTACQAACRTSYEACAKHLEPQIEARYSEALKRYEADLRRYAEALQRYEMQLRFDAFNAYPFGYPYGYPFGLYGWDPWWPRPYYPPPGPGPRMPTREGVRAQLEKTQCKADCGCLPAYDACFIGCGGRQISETLCVRNCPGAR